MAAIGGIFGASRFGSVSYTAFAGGSLLLEAIGAAEPDFLIYHFTQFAQFPRMNEFAPELFGGRIAATANMARWRPWTEQATPEQAPRRSYSDGLLPPPPPQPQTP